MSEYVAPIEEIRAEHAQALAQTTWYTEEEWLAKFDLALAEHDRKVAERAWDSCVEHVEAALGGDVKRAACADNPYTKGKP